MRPCCSCGAYRFAATRCSLRSTPWRLHPLRTSASLMRSTRAPTTTPAAGMRRSSGSSKPSRSGNRGRTSATSRPCGEAWSPCAPATPIPCWTWWRRLRSGIGRSSRLWCPPIATRRPKGKRAWRRRPSACSRSVPCPSAVVPRRTTWKTCAAKRLCSAATSTPAWMHGGMTRTTTTGTRTSRMMERRRALTSTRTVMMSSMATARSHLRSGPCAPVKPGRTGEDDGPVEPLRVGRPRGDRAGARRTGWQISH
mmetsp:Transcript_119779/g.344247  ORF Transcript_119779/g.344247 Transcript_119779/m.344247 type:complete len:253 (+) Transcript_119779:208-966(+)